MTMTLEELRAKVYAQKEKVPAIYGNIDFDKIPERFTDDPDAKSMLPKEIAKKFRGKILADKERVERARLYTMLGDSVSDAYVALAETGKYRVPQLIHMLKEACDKGVENVEGAPQELFDFIHEMEKFPEWLDMELVNEGARVSRNFMATLVPFAIRGAFIATFMNKYSGLPMALTGALAGQSALQRVHETVSFFTTASMPGALQRYGVGFKAAAMVRLMHSMVRYHILKRSDKWDVAMYGIPVPQIDQMPAGTMPSFIQSYNIMRKARGGKKARPFTRQERATAELCRYQSYLLGLPEELLPDNPEGIFTEMVTYASTLRDCYDDSILGEMVRSTMAAYRPEDKGWKGQLVNTAEVSFSKVFFSNTFLRGSDKYKAKRMGVKPTLQDYAYFAGTSLYILPQLNAHLLMQHIPIVSDIADRFLVKRLNELLVQYGHPEFVSDGSNYTYGKNQPGGNKAEKYGSHASHGAASHGHAAAH